MSWAAFGRRDWGTAILDGLTGRDCGTAILAGTMVETGSLVRLLRAVGFTNGSGGGLLLNKAKDCPLSLYLAGAGLGRA